MTYKDKAQQIVNNGLRENELFDFFTKANKDVLEHILLFGFFGVDSNIIWDAYEKWQCN